MKKQCIIIGLGKFGMTLAKELSEGNMEVLAIDKDMHLVERASRFVAKAICLNIYDEEALAEIPLRDFDLGIVAIGEDITTNIIACLALKEAKIDYIIAKINVWDSNGGSAYGIIRDIVFFGASK